MVSKMSYILYFAVLVFHCQSWLIRAVWNFYRVKQASRGKHEWASLPVPTSKNYLLVTGLLAGTTYQFSVLPQNKVGSGPFSEIVSVRIQGLFRFFLCVLILRLISSVCDSI